MNSSPIRLIISSSKPVGLLSFLFGSHLLCYPAVCLEFVIRKKCFNFKFEYQIRLASHSAIKTSGTFPLYGKSVPVYPVNNAAVQGAPRFLPAHFINPPPSLSMLATMHQSYVSSACFRYQIIIHLSYHPSIHSSSYPFIHSFIHPFHQHCPIMIFHLAYHPLEQQRIKTGPPNAFCPRISFLSLRICYAISMVISARSLFVSLC